ncbi:recombinase, phage RecT family [Aneurinibacillus thermoaerophilus]|uniref:Recombinase, phage RecT family n=1 Tax=Aneurinibacillus thermoaerophilus TaxID=143495 RepID=A0A1G7XB94_ANETH|nr:recombinase, phage RecT family [Aneurinibacillus thermoaerophilus]
MSIVSSAIVAATLDLPIDKNLGYAWIIPYGNKAQFHLGYKGYIQLALRSAQYRYINVTPSTKVNLKSGILLLKKSTLILNHEPRMS